MSGYRSVSVAARRPGAPSSTTWYRSVGVAVQQPGAPSSTIWNESATSPAFPRPSIALNDQLHVPMIGVGAGAEIALRRGRPVEAQRGHDVD